jgi:hypothetical protein
MMGDIDMMFVPSQIQYVQLAIYSIRLSKKVKIWNTCRREDRDTYAEYPRRLAQPWKTGYVPKWIELQICTSVLG